MKRHTAYIRGSQIVLWLLATFALVLLISHYFIGPQTLQIFTITFADAKIGMGLRLDILSTLLFFMVTTLAASIGHYSQRYLDGETRQAYFYKYLSGIVLSASLLVMASNLLMFFAMWLAMSYNLHKLLIYYNNRPEALMAARKKAIVSRFGDLALLAAIVLTYRLFGTFEFFDLFAKASAITDAHTKNILATIGVLFAIGALTKSAQFPFHFWLPDTMETPTPVSALMHAGVINAGGILVIRMSPMLQHDVAAHYVLALSGATSAAFGALCMIVQNDIKKKLAYSTVSQMGMMMLACGLGAYSIALFHIFAHSFYKAYAFLSTGKLVEESKKVGLTLSPPSMKTIVTAGVAGLSLIAAGGIFGLDAHLPLITYCAILLLGLLQNVSAVGNLPILRARAAIQIALALALAVTSYLAVEYSLNQTLETSVLQGLRLPADLPSMVGLSIATFSICFLAFILSARLMKMNTPFLERLYFYLRNGGYLGLRSSVALSRIYH